MLHRHRSCFLFTFTLVWLPPFESFSFSRLLTSVYKAPANSGEPPWCQDIAAACTTTAASVTPVTGEARAEAGSTWSHPCWGTAASLLCGKAKWARRVQPREEKALINVYQYLEWSCKEDEGRFLSVTPSKCIWSDTKHKPKQRRFLVNIRKHFFTKVTGRLCRLDPWRQSKYTWISSCVTSSRWPCLSRGIGKDDLWGSFPASATLILWKLNNQDDKMWNDQCEIPPSKWNKHSSKSTAN